MHRPPTIFETAHFTKCPPRLPVSFWRGLRISFGPFFFLILGLAQSSWVTAQQASEPQPAPPARFVETAIPYQGSVIVIRSKVMNAEKGIYQAEGDVIITFQDFKITADWLEYDSNRHVVSGRGNICLQKGRDEVRADHFEFDVERKTGRFYRTRSVTDGQFRIRAEEVDKCSGEVYEFKDGVLTTCSQEHPHWSFSSARARLVQDKSASLRGGVFRLFGVPLLYVPWIKFPILREERKSGFLIPSIGDSSVRGLTVTDSLYLVMGRSADLTLTGNYFSKRGFGLGTDFRGRFSEDSIINIASYSVHDRKGQGGTSINADSTFSLGHGIEGVVLANLTSSIAFRQTFEETFTTSIRPDQMLSAHIRKTAADWSLNLGIEEEKFNFESATIRTRATPDVVFHISGRQIGESPLFLYLDASGASFNKQADWWADSSNGNSSSGAFHTPGAVGRLDVYPRLFWPVQLGSLLRTTVTAGLRGTYYTDSLPPGSTGGDPIDGTAGKSITRQMADIEVHLEGPRIFRIFDFGGAAFKHVVESGATWRWAGGAGDFERFILFDSQDAVVNTNEVEYYLTNRLIGKRDGSPYEWASLTLAQKYFFDPSFDGILRQGQENQLEPYFAFTPYGASYYPRRFTAFQTTARVNPSPRFSGDMRLEYDPFYHGLRDWSLAGTFREEWLFLSVGYLRLRSFENQMRESHYLQTSVGFGRLGKGLSADVNLSYDFDRKNQDNVYARLSYYFDCLGFSVEYVNYNIYQLRRENQVRFSMHLKGIGQFGTLRNYGRRFF